MSSRLEPAASLCFDAITTAACSRLRISGASLDLKFGTSGLRGPAAALEEGAAARFTLAFARVLGERDPARAAVYVGRDRRASSPSIAAQVMRALAAANLEPVDCAIVPTPALAAFAMSRSAAAIMVTGSHIPADRNGLKFYTPAGEITKSEETEIARRAGEATGFDHPPLSSVDRVGEDVIAYYSERYSALLPERVLAGKRIGVFRHSSVSAEIIEAMLEKAGASVMAFGASKAFTPIDTEALDDETLRRLRMWTSDHRLDCIVSTDADGDRPLIVDETGRQVRGDALGLMAVRWLGARTVVTPVTSSSAIGMAQDAFAVRRTRVGSPYVIEAMKTGSPAPPVVGFEANGGFMLATPVTLGDASLPALPTRDALLPIVSTLTALAKANEPLSKVVSRLGLPVTRSARLADFPHTASVELMSELESSRGRVEEFVGGLGEITGVDMVDGLRVSFLDGSTLHIRPSGNAPEMRCYSEAREPSRADALLAAGLARLEAAARSTTRRAG